MFSDDETRKLGAALHDVVAEMLGRDLREGILPVFEEECPFDIERENIHEGKREYKSEKTTIRKWLKHLEALVDLRNRDRSMAANSDDMHDLVSYLNGWARANSIHTKPETAQDLAVSNAMRVEIVPCILMLNDQLKGLLEERLSTLEEQEKKFWDVSHRPPNYYARTISIRLAKLFARETGTYPTIGTSPYNGAPSTAFARALESTFSILSISQDFRGPGEWAISQLTASDLEPRIFEPGEIPF